MRKRPLFARCIYLPVADISLGKIVWNLYAFAKCLAQERNMPVVLTKTCEFGSELRELVSLLRNCVGPKGKLHMLTSATGQTSVTSVSTRLCPTLQCNFAHPVLTFLLNSAQAQTQRFKDGGLWTCICAGSLLDAMTKYEVSLISDFCKHGLSMFAHLAVRVDVSLDSVRPLLLAAESVLRSKPGAFGAACSTVSSVALVVVKAFIENSGMIGNVVAQCETGMGEPRLLSGLLWRATEDEVRLVRQADWRDASVVIVTGMLTDLKDPSEKVETDIGIESDAQRKLAAAVRLVNLVIKTGIRVLACQRVVHPKIELLAWRAGLLILPRLGTQTVARLEMISGAKAIRGDPAKIDLDFLLRSRGRLTSIHHEVMGPHDYLVLGGKLYSLLLYAPTSEVSAELIAVTNQALAVLTSVVADKAALPGAGCFEVWLCAQLWGKVTPEGGLYSTVKRSTVLSVLRSVQSSLLSAAGMDTRFMNNTVSMDSQRHHAWNSSLESCGKPSEQQCRCRLVTVQYLDPSTQWTIINEGDTGPPIQRWSPRSLEACPHFQDQSDTVLDALSVKSNAFKLAVETASTLASVGATLLPCGS